MKVVENQEIFVSNLICAEKFPSSCPSQHHLQFLLGLWKYLSPFTLFTPNLWKISRNETVVRYALRSAVESAFRPFRGSNLLAILAQLNKQSVYWIYSPNRNLKCPPPLPQCLRKEVTMVLSQSMKIMCQNLIPTPLPLLLLPSLKHLPNALFVIKVFLKWRKLLPSEMFGMELVLLVVSHILLGVGLLQNWSRFFIVTLLNLDFHA